MSNYPHVPKAALKGYVILQPNGDPLVASGTPLGHATANSVTPVTPSEQPDVPRTVDVFFGTGWDGGNVTLHGTRLGVAVSQVYVSFGTGGGTYKGMQVFDTLTSIVNGTAGSSTNTAQAQLSDIVGTSVQLTSPAINPPAPFVSVSWEDGDASTSGFFIQSIGNTPMAVDLSGQPPNGSTAYFVTSGP